MNLIRPLFNLLSRESICSILLLSCLTWLGGDKATSAQDSVAMAIDSIIQQVQPVLKQKKLTRVSVGSFTSMAGTASGPEIQVKLAEAIGKLGELKLDPADYDVKISGRLEKVELTNALAVRIVAQLFDAGNRPIGQFDGDGAAAEVLGQEAVPRLLGITTSSLGGDRSERDAALKKDIDQDPSVIQGQEVFAGTGSKFSISLLRKMSTSGSDFEAVTPTKVGRRGNAFAGLPMNSVFAVVLRNYSTQEVAVNLTLDGISVFAFSEQNPHALYWLVPAATDKGPGKTTVLGWDKNDNESFEFKTVEFPQSAAHKLKIEPNEAIGQICAQFSESMPAQPGSRAVGVGDIIHDKKQSVPRTIGAVQATIHVRYERAPSDKK